MKTVSILQPVPCVLCDQHLGSPRVYILTRRLSVSVVHRLAEAPINNKPATALSVCAQPREPPRGASPCGSCADPDATIIERITTARAGGREQFLRRDGAEKYVHGAQPMCSDAAKSQRRCRVVAQLQVHCASPRPPFPTHPLLSIISLSSPRRVRRAHNGEAVSATGAVADWTPVPTPRPTSAVFAAAAGRRMRRHRHHSRRRRATAVATMHNAHHRRLLPPPPP